MAKKPVSPKKEAPSGDTSPPKLLQATRKAIALDPQALAPVFVDYTTLVAGLDILTHSVFQSRMPAEGVGPQTSAVDTVLVGRFVYTPAHFEAVTHLFVKTLIRTQTQEKNMELVQWLQKQFAGRLPATAAADQQPSSATSQAKQGGGKVEPQNGS